MPQMPLYIKQGLQGNLVSTLLCTKSLDCRNKLCIIPPLSHTHTHIYHISDKGVPFTMIVTISDAMPRRSLKYTSLSLSHT